MTRLNDLRMSSGPDAVEFERKQVCGLELSAAALANSLCSLCLTLHWHFFVEFRGIYCEPHPLPQ